MATKRDFYEVLGINKNATKDEIKSAYRKLAKKYHPDNKETGNEAKFKEIQEAYDILYDDKKRSTYDQFGHAAFENAGAGPSGNPFEGGFGGFGGFGGEGVDLGDIFSSIFGGGSRRSQSSGPRRGDDALMRIKVDFMDAIKGRDIPLSINVDETCDSCKGTGAKTQKDIKTCPYCKGKGYVRVQKRSLFGVVEANETCPHCEGKGTIITEKCSTCGGKGYVRKKKDITVHVPPGINNGQQIRTSGMGERGSLGGGNGDLYIEIIVKPHPNFKREGNDIHLEVPIDFVDAALGCKIDVPTVYGDVTLTIPPGTQPNQILKMKGQGVKDLRSGKPGDQFIHLIVKVPTTLSKEQKSILESYRKAGKDNDSFFDKFKKAFKR